MAKPRSFDNPDAKTKVRDIMKWNAGLADASEPFESSVNAPDESSGDEESIRGPASDLNIDTALDKSLEDTENENEYLQYVETLTRSTAYAWLGAMISRVLRTTASTTSTDFNIRRGLVRCLCSGTETSNASEIRCYLLLDWSISSYFRLKQTSTKAAFAFRDTLIVCGTQAKPQCMTCIEYLDLIWPEIGRLVVSVLELSMEQSFETGEKRKLFMERSLTFSRQ